MGDPLTHILARTLMRPRDAIAYLNECLALARGKEKLTWPTINKAEVSYSANRLLALRDEWSPTFPGIDRALRCFARADATIYWDALVRILGECALLPALPEFTGTVWMTELSEPIWAGSSSDDEFEMYQPLIRLLHNIGFLGCIVSQHEPQVGRDVDDPAIYGYDNPAFPDHLSNLRQVKSFCVHPAFRPALDIVG